jgi:hypothetical protein
MTDESVLERAEESVLSGERHHSAESQISLEAIELSKKSRVADAL